MNYLAETIRVFGYVKRDAGYGTADRARTYYGFDHGMIRYKKYIEEDRERAEAKGFNPENPESVALAGKVIEWAISNGKDDNYFHNLKVAASLEYISPQNFGILASAFPAHDRQLERDAEEAARKANEAEQAEKSQYVGEVGKRVSFDLADYKCVTSWETMYGTTYVYKMVDGSGDVFTWKTGNGMTPYFAGDAEMVPAKITGTVKSHKEYRGVKQTELTRCRVEYGKKEHEPHNPEAEKAFQEFMEYCESA